MTEEVKILGPVIKIFHWKIILGFGKIPRVAKKKKPPKKKKTWRGLWIFNPGPNWSMRKKKLINATIFVLLILLLLAIVSSVYMYIARPERIVTKTVTVTKTETAQVLAPVTVAVSLPADQIKIAEQTKTITLLSEENARLRLALTPSAEIIWPTSSLAVTSDEARALLTKTFPNRRVTGAHFATATLYTLDQFRVIRSEMSQLQNNLSWPALIDKAIGDFQRPGLEGIPVGWAYPSQDPMYLIVVLYDAGQAKIFGFDPIDKAKIWEISTDSRVETAFIR